MPKCSVLKCPNRSETKGITLHRFPHSRPEVLKKWVRNIGRKDFIPSKISCLCNVHFEDHCFVNNRHSLNQFNFLKKDAVPTLFYYPLQSQNGTKLRLPTHNILSSAQRAINRNIKSRALENHDYTIQSSQFIRQGKVLATVSSPKRRPFIKKGAVENDFSIITRTSPMYLRVNGVNSPDDAKNISTINLAANSLKNIECMNALRKEVLKLESKVKKNQKALKIKQQNIRRLQKRITSLMEETKELEEAADLAKHPEKMAKQHFSGEVLDIILGLLKLKKNSKRTVSSPALRLFALNFYRISPRAYKFVYSTFKGGFPTPNAVRHWDLMEKKKRSEHIDDAILQIITSSQTEEIGELSTGMQSGNDNSQPSTSEEGYVRLNQCSQMELENENRIGVIAPSENLAEENFNTPVSKQFSSDLDELIRATLLVSNNSDSKSCYVVHLTDPNYNNKGNSDFELNDQKSSTHSFEEMPEEQNTVIIEGENFVFDENNIVIVTTE